MAALGSVLIVDDEADIRDGVARWLRAAGYHTSAAEDGVSGFEAAVERRPDAICLDMRMPRADGLQTLARLRVDPRTGDIPVIMLSASLRDEQRALDAGAAYFVPKPYDGRNLIKTLGATLASPAGDNR